MDMGIFPRMFANANKMIKIKNMEENNIINLKDSHLFYPRCSYVLSRSMTLIVCLIVIAMVAGYSV